MYRSLCSSDDYLLSAALEGDEGIDEELEGEKDEKGSADQKNSCQEFLKAMATHNDAAMIFGSEAEEGKTDDVSINADADLDGVPDRKLLEDLLKEKNAAEPFGEESAAVPEMRAQGDDLPNSLLEAMNLRGCMFNALFRLAVRLRSARGGCDLGFAPNPRNCRRAAKNLNWLQHLCSR